MYFPKSSLASFRIVYDVFSLFNAKQRLKVPARHIYFKEYASMTDKQPTASALLIGNELLSGRTQDDNLRYVAVGLAEIGVRLEEARIVPDVESRIVEALDALRARYDYVFTTGGIGPTHDDITVACVAKALHLPLAVHPEALARLERRYGKDNMNDSRRKMALFPEGCKLLDNAVNGAPGFYAENVYVMAGIPNIMRPCERPDPPGRPRPLARGRRPPSRKRLRGRVGGDTEPVRAGRGDRQLSLYEGRQALRRDRPAGDGRCAIGEGGGGGEEDGGGVGPSGYSSLRAKRGNPGRPEACPAAGPSCRASVGRSQ
jgi:hypothetical protein